MLIVESRNFRSNEELQKMCDLYLEYDLYGQAKVVMALKRPKSF